jgi:Flp pilus assembly protein TadG
MILVRVKTYFKDLAYRWYCSIEALAAVEAALVFPILLTLLLGTFDMGNGILANQKTIRSSQVVADLVTRERSIDEAGLNQAIEAGRLAFETLSSTTYGVDIISIRFDDDAVPEIVWRETRNMAPIADVFERVEPLAEEGNGVVVVAVRYMFEPVFAGFVLDAMPMQEVAFGRGRKSAVVNYE